MVDGPPSIEFYVNGVLVAQIKRGSIVGEQSSYPANLPMIGRPFAQHFITVKNSTAKKIQMFATSLTFADLETFKAHSYSWKAPSDQTRSYP